MDVSPIVSQITNTIWYLAFFSILIAVLKSNWFKGIFGEFVVNLSAKLMLNNNEYHLIKNVTLPTETGTTQIDHIIVSRFGVFVVETKNMQGWIFGSSNQKTWTQQIYKHKNKFQNPLRQNYKHIKTLEALLGLNKNKFYSVIVFIGGSTFKTVMPDNVTSGFGYIRYIKSKKMFVLSDHEVVDIVLQIQGEMFSRSLKTNREHVRHVKSAVAEKNAGRSCPKCGGQMVMREAKKGPNKGNNFWGCTNYLKCRGTVNTT